jgi:hypothetical protein
MLMSPKVMQTHVQDAMCHLDSCLLYALYANWNATHIIHLWVHMSSLPFSTFHPCVYARLA